MTLSLPPAPAQMLVLCELCKRSAEAPREENQGQGARNSARADVQQKALVQQF